MAWPNPNEYVEAIQHPPQAFSDSDLRGGSVITNRLGLPRPISGNFATVFEVEAGAQRWAVRCFLREVTNQQQRYAAISAHLKEYALPCMVNFEYLPEGIRVRGKWYPILKMDWTAGVRLDSYVEQHLADAQRLRQLAERWVTLCRALRQAHIAHGDLQHGNILVTDQHEIKLIDYDGMIVPDVIGLANREIGHRHYQHPTRTTDDGITLGNFENVDNFSCHVIGLSLLALSIDPSLWAQTKAGEENLLFRDTDYKSPETSATFDLFDTHEDPRIRAVGETMLAAVQSPSYLDVPPFNRSPLDGRSALDNRWTWVKSWLTSRAPVSEAAMPTPRPKRSSWVFDHLEAPPLDFSDEFVTQERIAIEVEFDKSILRFSLRLFLPFALARLLMRYPSYPLVIEKAHAERVARSLEKQITEAKARRKTLSRLIVEAERRYQQEVRTLEVNLLRLNSDLDYAQRQEARELLRLEHAVQSLSAELARQPLEPDSTGISAAWIAALAQIGIQSAAEITPANRSTALRVLTAAEWDQLVEWRTRVEQQLSAMPISPDDVRSAREQHAVVQRDLADQQQSAQRQLAEVSATSDHLQMAQSLRGELGTAQAQVSALQGQLTRARADRERYGLITLRRFLSRMLDWPH